MIIVATGNAFDVVYDYDSDGNKVFRGVQRHSSREVIPLPDPIAFAEVILKVAEECGIKGRTER